jgi:hypothetical protein
LVRFVPARIRNYPDQSAVQRRQCHLHASCCTIIDLEMKKGIKHDKYQYIKMLTNKAIEKLNA